MDLNVTESTHETLRRAVRNQRLQESSGLWDKEQEERRADW
jgi:hypothetical protein